MVERRLLDVVWSLMDSGAERFRGFSSSAELLVVVVVVVAAWGEGLVVAMLLIYRLGV
jgi:hypothetical protein|tara:strand:+ start:1640 stop:1813 length:174 start_codon:yes stop_codon:yes gene_type:complete